MIFIAHISLSFSLSLSLSQSVSLSRCHWLYEFECVLMRASSSSSSTAFTARRYTRRVIRSVRSRCMSSMSLESRPSEEHASSFQRDGFLVLEEFASSDALRALREEGARLAMEDEASLRRVAALASRSKQEHQNEQDAMKFVKSASGVTCFYEKDGETVNKVGHALHDKLETFKNFSRSARVKNLLR